MPLSDDDRAVLSARADQFFAVLAGGSPADWDAFLVGLTEPLRTAVLTELIVIDLGYRWENGERPVIEDYLARFPELGPAERVPSTLILEEHRCRSKAGEATAADYESRFPAQFAALQTQLGTGSPETRTVVRPTTPPTHVPPSAPRSAEGFVAVSHQYEMVRQLGRGMFGEVWLARKQPSGIEKAVKILLQPADQEVAQRERKSLELIKNLRHPYLLATEDFWVADNRLYIVLELADATLRGRMKECRETNRPGIPEDELLGYLREAAEGLDFLHVKKITHRDVKPDNILILNGHAKVADFGLARALDPLGTAVSFAGTPAYIAPEVWGGEAGPAGDQYALAVAYVELRQGRLPFRFGKGTDVMLAHVEGRFEFDVPIRDEERPVLRRALARNPEDRYPSCLAFAEELTAALGRPHVRKTGVGPAPAEPTLFATVRTDPVAIPDAHADTLVGPPRQNIRRRNRRLMLAGLGVAVLMTAGIGYAIRNGGNGDSSGLATPTGTQAEADAKVVDLADGRRVPEWVVATRGEETVRFRLIAPTGGANAPPPFFISESKMWNRLAAETGDRTPTINITGNDAAAFAEKTFAGRLPTPAEWDHAAGFHDRRGLPGPLRPGGTAIINAAAPLDVTVNRDARRNQFDLIDMAGNGREWTAAVLPGRGQPLRIVTGPGFAATDLVVLRGRNYTLAESLTYDILQTQQADPQTQFAGVASPFTGFRVVLPLP